MISAANVSLGSYLPASTRPTTSRKVAPTGFYPGTAGLPPKTIPNAWDGCKVFLWFES